MKTFECFVFLKPKGCFYSFVIIPLTTIYFTNEFYQVLLILILILTCF